MQIRLTTVRLIDIWRNEFRGYSRATFQRDLLAGLTVGAVALPLALAFGVASGATPAAGLITAILAGLLIAGFGGAAYQISGPTGAMAAILIGLTSRYGLAGVWTAGVLSGAILIALGLFRLGRYIAFIPAPVITGFTSGIALIIAIGQLDNVLGVAARPAENTMARLLGYILHPPSPDWRALVIAGLVIATMIIAPRISTRLPGSLAGLIVASLVTLALGWNIPVIGKIPSTLLLDQRLTLGTLPWAQISELIPSAIAIAALGAIETLLCGAVGATMTGRGIDNNQELIGQGIGNLIIPFFGGVPATAAIARSSVAIKSGAVTRLTSLVHAGVLILAVLALGSVIGRVPMAALGGVLLMTAWRMNEWKSIRFFIQARIRHALAAMAVTMVATIALDLTQAILIGLTVSMLIYVKQSVNAIGISADGVDLARVRGRGYALERACPDIRIYTLTGAIFFGSVGTVVSALERRDRHYRTMIISLRGVPLIDVMGVEALERVIHQQHARGGEIYLTGVQPSVRRMLERTGLDVLVGLDHIRWNAVEATVVAQMQHASGDCPHCQGLLPVTLLDQDPARAAATAPEPIPISIQAT
jgi:SulP family sulfate permease